MGSIGNVHKAELNDAQTLTIESDTLRYNEWLLTDLTGDGRSGVWDRHMSQAYEKRHWIVNDELVRNIFSIKML